MATTPAPARPRRGLQLLGALLALAIVVALVAISCRPTSAPPAPPPAGPPQTVLRLVGSNTIGSRVAPDLAEGFLTAEGASDVRRESAPGVVTVSGTPAGSGRLSIEIHDRGTETAFAGLRAGDTDVAMASRRITSQEATDLAARGDLTDRASEHVLALDAVAVVVPEQSPLTALSIEQLRGVFTCTVTDWSQVGGRPGPVHVLARDANSGTFESFRDAVLAGRPLCPSAQLYDDSANLSDAVKNDPAAIGFVGLPFVRPNRALDLFDEGTPRVGPTPRACPPRPTC